MQGRVFRTLDGIRGAAALLIVMRHAETFFVPYSFQESYLAVDLFFVMSGVVLCRSYEAKLLQGLAPTRFAWIRVVRIEPLYLLGCGLSVVAIVLNPDSIVHLRDLPRLMLLAVFIIPDLSGIDTYPLNAPSWSLFFELLINFVYGFSIKMLRRRLLVAVTVLSGLMLIPIIAFSQHHNLNLGFTARSFPTGLFRVAYSFFAGVIICRLYERAPAMVGGSAGNLLSWMVLGLVVVILSMEVNHRVQPYFDYLVVTLAFPLIVYGSLRFVMSGASAAMFRFLGVTSYAIYVLHAPLARLIESRLPHHGGSMVPYAPWAGFAFMASLVVLAYAVDTIYDIPVRRFLLRQPSNRAVDQ